MRFLAVEDESCRERTPELAQILQRTLATLIAAHLERSLARDSNLNVVAFLQFERLNDSGG